MSRRAPLGALLAVLLLGLAGGGAALSAEPREDFPLPAAMRSAVAFWLRVYLENTTQGGLIHDSRQLGVVYETVRFEEGAGKRKRERKVEGRKRHWRAALRRLAKGAGAQNDAEARILHLLELELGHPPNATELRRAAQRIRFQLGQRDKFRRGIIQSGAYENLMRAIFRGASLPEDLAYLPHVESSFNLSAYSKYGAAGIWQFMRSTGHRYLRIDYVIDERLDPIVATRAAARLLKDNYASLNSWPLAITAYNHGVSGMRRAKRKLGTDDIATVVARYRSRSFGFASRNFYAQFMAARKILHDYEIYFGPLERDDPLVVDEVTLPFFVDVEVLKSFLGLSPEILRHYNGSLRPTVFRSGKRIPKGYVLRLPAGTVLPSTEEWLARIPEDRRHRKQHLSHYHRVRRGDTLSGIASRYRASVRTLVAINNLPSRHRIYPGQVLQLPGKRGATKRSGGLVRTAHAQPRRVQIPKERIQPLSGPPPGPSDRAPWRLLDGEWILVDALETLGHYANWLEIPTQRLRDLNDLSRRRTLRMGQRLHLDFSRVEPAVFLQRRLEYHKGIEEDFFGSYRVTGTVEHKLRRGESLWVLSHRVYGVPTWLIKRYNPDASLTGLKPGTTLRIPVVEPTSS